MSDDIDSTDVTITVPARVWVEWDDIQKNIVAENNVWFPSPKDEEFTDKVWRNLSDRGEVVIVADFLDGSIKSVEIKMKEQD